MHRRHPDGAGDGRAADGRARARSMRCCRCGTGSGTSPPDRRRVLFAARGSSDNAAIYGRYLLETHAGVARRTGVAERGHPLPQPPRPVGRCRRERLAVRRDRGDRGHPGVGPGVRRGHRRRHQRRRAPRSSRPPTSRWSRRPARSCAVPATKTYLTQLVAMAALGTALAPDPHGLDAAARPGPRRGGPAAGERPASSRRSPRCGTRRTPSSRAAACCWAPRWRRRSSWRRPACGRCAATRTPTCGTARSRS